MELKVADPRGTTSASWKIMSMSQPGLSSLGNRHLGWHDAPPAKIHGWSRKHQETIRGSDTCMWRNPEPFEAGHSDDIDHRFTFNFPPHHLSPLIHQWGLKKEKTALCISHLNIFCDIHEILQCKRLTKEWNYRYMNKKIKKAQRHEYTCCEFIKILVIVTRAMMMIIGNKTTTVGLLHISGRRWSRKTWIDNMVYLSKKNTKKMCADLHEKMKWLLNWNMNQVYQRQGNIFLWQTISMH